MADGGIKYLVEVEFSSTGSPFAGGGAGGGSGGSGGARNPMASLAGIQKATEDASREARTMSSAYAEVGKNIIGAFEAGGDAIVKYGGIAATAGIGLLTNSALELHSSLEKTEMSLASIFTVGGATSNLNEGMKLAHETMGKMRKDAADLPGEFQDLVGIMRQVSTTGLQMGMSVPDIEKLSARTMAAAATMGMNSQQAARELVMTLQGRVGAHNPFATQLGITPGAEADKYRGLSAQDRLKDVNSRLGKYDSAIAAFGGTWDAQSSQLVDHGKKFLGDSTQPLFDKAKDALKDINEWLGANTATTTKWATIIGGHLGNAFEEGKRILLEYGPVLSEFAENAYHKFHELSSEVSVLRPLFESIGATIKDALKDPGTIDKFITMMKLYAGLKIGGAALGVGSALLGPIMGAGASMGPGALTAPLGSLLAPVGGLAASAAGAAAALGLLAVSAFAAYELYTLHKEYGEAKETINEDEWRRAREAVRNVRNLDGDTEGGMSVGINSVNFGDAVRDAEKTVSVFDDALWEAKHAIDSVFGSDIAGLSPQDNIWRKMTTVSGHEDYVEQQQSEQAKMAQEYLGSMMMTQVNINAEKMKGQKPKEPPPGVTNVYVTQTISSNQAPGQIARRAVDMIADMATKGAASRRVPNYSARTR